MTPTAPIDRERVATTVRVESTSGAKEDTRGGGGERQPPRTTTSRKNGRAAHEAAMVPYLAQHAMTAALAAKATTEEAIATG